MQKNRVGREKPWYLHGLVSPAAEPSQCFIQPIAQGSRCGFCAGVEARLPLCSVPLFFFCHTVVGEVFGAISLTRDQHFQRSGARNL